MFRDAQVEVSGSDAEQFLETVLVSDLRTLKSGKGTMHVKLYVECATIIHTDTAFRECV